MPRLFTALRFPSDVNRSLDRLCQGLPGVRWTHSDAFHLTLRFIGETDHPTFCDIGEGLMDLRLPPFELQLKGLGHFPKKGPLRQLWVGVEPSPELGKLRRQIDRVLIDAGVTLESRKFTPHVTIGRLVNPPPTDRLVSYFSRRESYKSPVFPVNSFELLSSHLGRNHAEHIVEADYDFVRGVMERA